MITLNPYLVFKGNCESAFNFYKIIFGGKILYLGRYKDIPQESRHFFPNALDDKIMHASLQLTQKNILMGCDRIEAEGQSTTGFANNFYLYMSTDNHEEAIRIFNELSVGGEITMSMNQTFWSTNYGMLTDKFGIHWKIASDQSKK